MTAHNAGPLPPYELADHVRKARYFLCEDDGANPAAGSCVVFGGLEYCGPDYEINRRTYPVYCLEIVVDGQGTVDLGDGHPQPLQAGSVCLHGPDLPCKIVTDPKALLTKYFVTFRSPALPLPASAAREGNRLCQSSAADGLIALAEMLQQEGVRRAPESAAICNHLLEVILLRFGRLLALKSVRSEHAWKVFETIRNTIDQRFLEFQTLGEVAAAVGLNVSYISRLFQRHHDTTPYKYLQHRKIEHAAGLLRREGRSVANAAAETGFDDPFHFSRVFKKIKGFSPVHYRRDSEDVERQD